MYYHVWYNSFMKLVLLYGPPAVGKFTIAEELAKLTGFKNFHNHAILDVVNEIFGFDHPLRRKLEHKIRQMIVVESAIGKIDLIATGVIVNVNKALYQGMIDAYEKEGGSCVLVKLIAEKATLDERVIHESRKKKISSVKVLDEFFGEYPESFDQFTDRQQLVINTSRISPQATAKKIIEFYKLKI